MTDNVSAADKRIVEELTFGAKTAKRVSWESFEFAVVGPYQVEVTNAAYGCEKDTHAYVVTVEERGNIVVPVECECKADQYRDEYDCKHKVALASVGGPVVLQAAVEYESQRVEAGGTTTQTLKDKLRADGGTTTERTKQESNTLCASEHETCLGGNDWCDGRESESLSCFACFDSTEGQ